MSDRNLNKGAQIAIIVGGALILFGLVQLLQFVLGPFWSVISGILHIISSIAWPLFIVAVGALLIWKATKGEMPKLGDKKLYRSTSDKWVSGVLGGLGDYFRVDSTWLRLAFIVLLAANFWFAVVAYFVLAVVIPESPFTTTS